MTKGLAFSPIVRCRLPRYPARAELAPLDQFLLGHMPDRWARRRDLTRAAGFLLGLGTMTTLPGCIVGAVAQMEPLSENHALSVIKDELARHSLPVMAEKTGLPGVTLTAGDGTQQQFVVDLANTAAGYAVEYVSTEDYRRWDLDDSPTWQEFAASLKSAVQAQSPDLHLAVFQSELVSLGDPERAAEQARETLRQQVRDFVEWLESQGVI